MEEGVAGDQHLLRGMRPMTTKVQKQRKTKYVAPRLTKEQRATADSLLQNYQNLCLMSGLYKGEPAAFICSVWHEDDGPYKLMPVFMVVTDKMMDDCQDAEGRSVEELNQKEKK